MALLLLSGCCCKCYPCVLIHLQQHIAVHSLQPVAERQCMSPACHLHSSSVVAGCPGRGTQPLSVCVVPFECLACFPAAGLRSSPAQLVCCLLFACLAAYVYIHTCGRSLCMHQCQMSGYFKQGSSCYGGLGRPGMPRVHTCSGVGVCVISRLCASGLSVCGPRQSAALSVAHWRVACTWCARQKQRWVLL